MTLPFNINGVALAAMHAALQDTEFLPAIRRAGAANRVSGYMRRSVASGSSTGRAPPTTSWCASARRLPVVEGAGGRKIHVRDRSKDPTTPGCIRMTAGMLEHTDAAIEALDGHGSEARPMKAVTADSAGRA